VEMAIKALAWMVRVFDPPVYCYHEIVHNQIVVDRFRRLGVVFVDDVGEVPEGAPLMLSAHGSAPEVVAAARAHGGVVVDAVCPLVTKVHHEVKVRAGKGYTVVYVGHEGHDEAVGTMAVAPDAVRLVENEADVHALALGPDEPVAFLAQTTLSMDDWSGVHAAAAARFPEMWMPGRSDLCFATTNRQTALKAIATRADALVVIGSANSSNTRALENVARTLCQVVVRVNGADEVPDGLHGVVGVTAGASAPEELVRAVIERLAPAQGVEMVSVTDEDEYFPPPRELRDLLRAAVVAVSASLFVPADPTAPLADDRAIAASDVLDALSAAVAVGAPAD
ncbi:MAG: 4-hydroxy-3-methylbut-2-enyl diphosphate reductase, partial [Acidimicrobiales bacterium]